MAPTINVPQYSMPASFPWGMPPSFVPEGYQPPPPFSEVPIPVIPAVQPMMSTPPPVVHTVPFAEEQLYHAEPSESLGMNERLDDFQDQFAEMQRELKALKGKELFGKSAYELCLVPNVKIPLKFKVPDFEKYKGNSCPISHLTMYARKMSTHTDNNQLLIHYFQDSLTGAALKWYMDLDSTKIRTFNDLGTAFVKQYKYNVDMAPDRDQLRAMSQKDKETFKEYVQRWREISAQVSPPMEEKEMTKIFLKTLSSF